MPFDLIVRLALAPPSQQSRLTPILPEWGFHILCVGTQSGKFIPEKSNIWRDCVDGFYDWVKQHIEEVGLNPSTPSNQRKEPLKALVVFIPLLVMQGAPLNESDHCGDPPLLLAAGNGEVL